MLNVYPDYYNEFKCINSRCQHNCCIGWDIYIDDITAEKYENIDGVFGEWLRSNIDFSQEKIVLGKDKRCPFLNENNLCDIIINIGEEYLCDICKNHPRFINELPGRIETGIGLSCEEATRIIIGKPEQTRLIINGNDETTDELLNKRDEIFEILQNRDYYINERLHILLQVCNAHIPDKSFEEWIDLFITFERLDNKWGDALKFLKNNYKNADYSGFDKYMQYRTHEYEQLAVYLIYRYYANCFDLEDASAVIVFTYLCHSIIYALGATVWTRTGTFNFEQQVELIRTFSAEIEYSDQIMNRIWDELYNY